MSACSVCGESVSAPLALCWNCSSLAGDALVFVRRPENGSEHADAVQALLALLPGRPRSEDLSLAARGHKAVALVPLDEADRIKSLFRGHEVEVVVTPRSSARAPLPVGLRLVVGLILAAGGLAGVLVAPILLATSPLVAGLLWLSAQRQLRRPLSGLAR